MLSVRHKILPESTNLHGKRMYWRIILLACLLALSACKKKTTDVPIAGSIGESVEVVGEDATQVAPTTATAETCATPECEKACAGVGPTFAKDCPRAYNVGCRDGTAPAGFPCDSFTSPAGPAAGETAGDSPSARPKLDAPSRVVPASNAGSKAKKAAEGSGDDPPPTCKPPPFGD